MSKYKTRSNERHIGPGWESLIDKTLEKLYEHGWKGDSADIRVRERFGTLRIELFNGRPVSNGPFDTVVREAELQSTRICKSCGEAGEMKILHTPSVVHVMCNDCYDLYVVFGVSDDHENTGI